MVRLSGKVAAAVAVACVGISAGVAQAAVVATYLPPPTGAGIGTPILTAASVDPLLTASSVTVGNATANLAGSFSNTFLGTGGANGSDPAIPAGNFYPNSFAANGRTGTGSVVDDASAIAAGAYFTFNLQPTAGNQLQLSTITFDVAAGSNSSIRGYDLRSSADGYATSLVTEAFAAGQTTYVEGAQMEYVVANLSSLATVSDAAPITFRMYAWNGAPTGGASGKNVDFDNIVVSGLTSAVPEPVSISLLALGGLTLMRRRNARQS
jgi:hypothetical protein